MIVVDASVWISALVKEDVNNAQSLDWLTTRTLDGRLMYLPGIILPEVSGAVNRRTGLRHDGTLALRSLTSNPYVQIVDTDEELAVTSAEMAIQCEL